jgi:hypothetical protein
MDLHACSRVDIKYVSICRGATVTARCVAFVTVTVEMVAQKIRDIEKNLKNHEKKSFGAARIERETVGSEAEYRRKTNPAELKRGTEFLVAFKRNGHAHPKFRCLKKRQRVCHGPWAVAPLHIETVVQPRSIATYCNRFDQVLENQLKYLCHSNQARFADLETKSRRPNES